MTDTEKDTASAPAMETVIDKGVPKGELKLQGLLLIMGIGWFIDSLKVDGIFQGANNGPGTIAQLVAMALIAMVLGRVYVLLRAGHKDGSWRDLKGYLFDNQVILVIVMVLLYGLLVETLHFVPTSIIFLSVTMYLLDRKNPVKKVIISCIFVGVLYLIFSTAFQVVLP